MTRTILALCFLTGAAQAQSIYTLAFSACLDATHCARHEMQVDSRLGYGIPFLARWVEEHPGWSVVHWTCAEGVSS